MTRNKFLLLLSLLVLFSAGASASPACTTNTFAFYMTHPCSIGLVSFDFSAPGAYAFTPDDYNPAAADVTVTPVGSGLVAGQQVGFTFTNNNFVVNAPAGTPGYNQNSDPFSGSPTCCVAGSQANPSGTGWISTNPDVSGNGLADLNLTFSASINAPHQLNSTTTVLDVFIFSPDGGGTIVQGGETVTDNSGGAIGNLQYYVDHTSTFTTGTAFSSPVNSLNVNKDIAIQAIFANTTPNSAALNSVTETFTFTGAVPEPGSFLLIGLTGLLFAAYKWRKLVYGFFVLGMLLVVSAPRVHAAPLCTSVTQTMAGFEALGAGGCTIGNDLFYNFSYTVPVKLGHAAAPSAANPTFAVNPTQSAGVAGFRFQPTVVTDGGGAVDGQLTVVFSFNVKVGENLLNPGFTTTDTGSTNGAGTFAGSNVTLNNGASTVGSVSYPNDGSSPIPGTCCSGILAGTVLTVTNTFTFDSKQGSSSNTTHLSNFTDTFSETLPVPEPLSALLIGGGLLGFAFLGRKVYKRS